jgi:hypothetical protein
MDRQGCSPTAVQAAMPVKQRSAKARRPTFSAEALDLFEELERMRSQRSEAFRDKSLRLARMLGLTTEWWCSITHVNERGPPPVHPEGYVAREAWFRCRAVRIQLLQAVRERRTTRKLEAAAEHPEPAA